MKENYIKWQKSWISTSHKMSNIFKQYPLPLLLSTQQMGVISQKKHLDNDKKRLQLRVLYVAPW